MAERAPRRPGRAPRSRVLLRSLALVGCALVVFVYYRPLRTYVERRDLLERRSAEVSALAARRSALERRLADSQSRAALEREARRLGLVRPGERLFIVRGIPEWRRARAAARPRP